MNMFKQKEIGMDWKDCNEELPEDYEVVVAVYYSDLSTVTLAWIEDGSWRAEPSGEYIVDDVTDWLPLPELKRKTLK